MILSGINWGTLLHILQRFHSDWVAVDVFFSPWVWMVKSLVSLLMIKSNEV